VEELLKVGAVENTVSSGTRVVDGEFMFGGGGLCGGGLGNRKFERHEPTEKVTQQSVAWTNHLGGERVS